MKSAIASSADSSSSSESTIPSAGSASITAGQVVTESMSLNSVGASEEKTSTSAGSNWVPLRSRATATAASTPPLRW